MSFRKMESVANILAEVESMTQRLEGLYTHAHAAHEILMKANVNTDYVKVQKAFDIITDARYKAEVICDDGDMGGGSILGGLYIPFLDLHLSATQKRNKLAHAQRKRKAAENKKAKEKLAELSKDHPELKALL